MVNLSQPEETLKGSIHLLNSYEQIGSEVERIYVQGEDFDLVKPYLDQLESDIKRAKATADYVIVIMHNGSQYIREVDPYSLFLADKIKQFGANIIIGHHQHLIQSCDTTGGYLKIFCLGNFINDQFIEGDGYYFDSPLYNAVFHLSLDKKEDGTIEAKKSFSIYTTVKNKDGLSCVIDAYDVYKKKSEPYLGRTILRAANLFAGSKRYTEIRERYEL
jgi:poly-gamma-glutamate capsule biosynthesis protein CapA/YwtB (metallophosphatase superfamily)